MAEETTRRTLNLTQLRKNKRKRADLTSGRKRPRVNDIDVVAAGDADPGLATRTVRPTASETIPDGDSLPDVTSAPTSAAAAATSATSVSPMLPMSRLLQKEAVAFAKKTKAEQERSKKAFSSFSIDRNHALHYYASIIVILYWLLIKQVSYK